MVFTILHKILQKTIFTGLNQSRGIKHQSKAFFDRSNRYWASIKSGKNFKSISWPIQSIKQKFRPIEQLEPLIFTKKIPDLEIQYYSFYKWILSNLISFLKPILVYTFIYNTTWLASNLEDHGWLLMKCKFVSHSEHVQIELDNPQDGHRYGACYNTSDAKVSIWSL